MTLARHRSGKLIHADTHTYTHTPFSDRGRRARRITVAPLQAGGGAAAYRSSAWPPTGRILLQAWRSIPGRRPVPTLLNVWTSSKYQQCLASSHPPPPLPLFYSASSIPSRPPRASLFVPLGCCCCRCSFHIFFLPFSLSTCLLTPLLDLLFALFSFTCFVFLSE